MGVFVSCITIDCREPRRVAEFWPFRNVVLRDPEGNEFCLGSEAMSA